MNLLAFLTVLVASCVVSAAEPPTELKIETTFMPDSCPVKAAKGDQIKVHYVRRVLALYCGLL